MDGGAIAVIVVGLFIYFIPAIVANSGKRKNATAITVLNIVLGWTLLGWVVALVWACCNDSNGSLDEEKTKGPQELQAKKEDSYDALSRLADLRDRGALTDEEFLKEKDKILGKSS